MFYDSDNSVVYNNEYESDNSVTTSINNSISMYINSNN